MTYQELGRTGEKISNIVLGAWTLGDGNKREDMSDESSIAAIRAAMDAGITLIDTAEIYGGGRSEEIIGKAIKGRRSDIMVATKVWRDNLSAEGVRKALDASLKRLDTDYVDIYQIHRPSDTVPIEETMGALVKEQEKGRIRYLGVSNFSAAQMEEASKIARFETSQPPWNLFWRFVEDEDNPWCRENGVTVIPWSPLGQGVLSGKYDVDHPLPEKDGRNHNLVFMQPTFPVASEAIVRMREMASDLGCTVPQMALAWLIHQPGSVAPIAGPRTPEQLEGVLPAADLKLPEEVLCELDTLGRKVTDSVRAMPELWNVYEMWPK